MDKEKTIRIERLGESALILRDLGVRPAWTLADAISGAGISGVLEAVPSYESVGVYFDPVEFEMAAFESLVQRIPPAEIAPRKSHTIPVCYELGEDLAEVAAFLNLRPEEVVRHHAEAVYTCYAVGFCPGFAFLGYLPEAISGVPRKPSPRVRTAPGSVGITGRQTGVYPLERPGGWPIIGMTPLTLVDLEDAYFPIEAGDEVRFRAIDSREFEALKGERL